MEPIGPSNKELAATIFSPVGEGTFRCRIYAKHRAQQPGKGYTNLVDHLARGHSTDTITTAFDQIRRFGPSYPLANIDSEAKGVHGWIEWIVMENHPLSFCESEFARKNSNLPVISVKTLKSYMNMLVSSVRDSITELLQGKRIGIMFDGWSENGYHFVGTFGVTARDHSCTKEGSSRNQHLLSFKPIQSRTFGSDDIINIFDAVLDKCRIDYDQLCFFVGDNASVNVAIGKKVDIPLIGCAIHRLHLAAEKHLEPYDKLLDKLSEVVRYLRNGKQRAVLREEELHMPVLRNTTRWSSSYGMIERYLELAPHLDDSDPALAPLLLNAEEKNRLRSLLAELKKFESVSKKLQESSHLTLRHVRVLFDKLLSEFPTSCKRHLSPDARVVAFPSFENGIVKVQSRRETELTAAELAAIRRFRLTEDL